MSWSGDGDATYAFYYKSLSEMQKLFSITDVVILVREGLGQGPKPNILIKKTKTTTNHKKWPNQLIIYFFLRNGYLPHIIPEVKIICWNLNLDNMASSY